MREWTSSELAALRANAHLGAVVVAELLGRSLSSVKHQARRQRISLRVPGERRGLVLGQPRGVRWADQAKAGVPAERLTMIREQVLAGLVDMGVLEARVRDWTSGRPRPICPACGQRPIERTTTGTCEVCHWTHLARAHRDEADRIEARRALDAARQSKSRASRHAGPVDPATGP